MTTRHRPFPSAPLPEDLTADLAITLWKEAHEIPPEPSPDFLFSPGELHGMTPPLPGHLGTPMLRRACRRHRTGGEPSLAH